jgi:hypothetical protein
VKCLRVDTCSRGYCIYQTRELHTDQSAGPSTEFQAAKKRARAQSFFLSPPPYTDSLTTPTHHPPLSTILSQDSTMSPRDDRAKARALLAEQRDAVVKERRSKRSREESGANTAQEDERGARLRTRLWIVSWYKSTRAHGLVIVA